MVKQFDEKSARLRRTRVARIVNKILGRVIAYLQKIHKRRRIDYPLGPGFQVVESPGGWTLKDPFGSQIALATPSRFYLYSRGINRRVDILANEYCLTNVRLEQGATIVDVGANVGELALWAKAHDYNYIGFEPDPSTFAALEVNGAGFQVFKTAISNVESESELYLRTGSADTTLLRPDDWTSLESSVTVVTETLDEALSEAGCTQGVGLLKVEAEGGEPEVLEGAQSILRRTSYVVVDAGPERNGLNTVPDVITALYSSGFVLIERSNQRETYLFENLDRMAG